jgi:hypothetical protein
MGLPTRNLDDRTFQDIVDEAKKRIAASCPDWTDHNVSDPGITLVELFAWMTDMSALSRSSSCGGVWAGLPAGWCVQNGSSSR